MADAVRLLQGGRLPSLESLVGKTDAELNLLLRRFGLAEDRAQRLEDAVVRATRQLTSAKHPSQAVVDRAIKQTEAAVRRELMQTSKETLRAYQAQRRGAAAVLVWVAVNDGGDDRTCDDCAALHGTIKTAAEWQSYGEPGGDNTVCDGTCRCTLEDAAGYDTTRED